MLGSGTECQPRVQNELNTTQDIREIFQEKGAPPLKRQLSLNERNAYRYQLGSDPNITLCV